MRPFVRVKMLTSEDYKQLRKLAKSRKLPAGKAKRAKMVLLSNQGYTAREIAAKLDCNKRTDLSWIGRFNSCNLLDGLARRSGHASVRSHLKLPFFLP